MSFSIRETTFNDKITHIYELQEKFFLYDYSCKEEYFKNNVGNFDEVLQAQIDVFSNKNSIDVKYQDDYMIEYFNKIQKDGKYIIRDTKLGELIFNRDDMLCVMHELEK